MRKVPILLTLSCVAACNRNVYTPPARPMALTSPATVEPETTLYRAVASTSSELFGPSLIAASIGARHGIADRLEVEADVSYAQIVEESVAGTNRGIGMVRVGAKYNPIDSPHLAVVGGLGGGFAPAGGAYTSADVGVVVGYENKYVVPFVSAGVFGSAPLNAKEVDITRTDDSETFTDTPEETLGLSLGAGLKVPIQTTAVVVGITSTQLYDSDSDAGFMSLGAAVESSF